jgi:hypothetical protein
MSELSKKFFVATTVLEQTDSGFVESRLDNVPDPVAVPAARTSTLYDELKAQREMADAAHLERFKHKPPRGLDEDDELFLMTRGNEEKSVAERERTQANSDRQEFQVHFHIILLYLVFDWRMIASSFKFLLFNFLSLN